MIEYNVYVVRVYTYDVSLSRSRKIGLPLRIPSSVPPLLGFLLFLEGVGGLVGGLSSPVRSMTVRFLGVVVGDAREVCSVSASGGNCMIHPLLSMSAKNSSSRGST